MYAIEAIGLSKQLDATWAVEDVSFQVPEGVIYGLIGPNGAGKSTLIRLLLGILKPTRGEVRLFGKLANDPTGDARQGVGFVPDTSWWPHGFRVEDALEWHRLVYPHWDGKRASRLLDLFELPKRVPIRELSKGQKMQLSLSCTLATRPKLLFLDEPTNGLDPVVRREFMQLIVQQFAQDETTMLFSTHLLEDLGRVANQIGVMYRGKLLLSRALDTLESSIRKILVVFRPENEPDVDKWPEVWRSEREGRLHMIWVGENADEVLQRIQTTEPVYWEAFHPTLDDIFIEMMRKEGYGHANLELMA
jgi:ABC-2 type transport system ATP-binding protein